MWRLVVCRRALGWIFTLVIPRVLTIIPLFNSVRISPIGPGPWPGAVSHLVVREPLEARPPSSYLKYLTLGRPGARKLGAMDLWSLTRSTASRGRRITNEGSAPSHVRPPGGVGGFVGEPRAHYC